MVAFQPHRFTRTQALFGEFSRVFANVDELLLTEIYPASESPIPGVSGQSLAQAIRQVTTTPVRFFENFAAMQAARCCIFPVRTADSSILKTST